MGDPNFVFSNDFVMVARRNKRDFCLNVSIWDFITISFCFISAIVILAAQPMLSFDLFRMFELSDKSFYLNLDAVLHFSMASNLQWPKKLQQISHQFLYVTTDLQ